MPADNETPWWSQVHLDWKRPEPVKLRDLLMHAYQERSEIREVLTRAGLCWPKAPGGDASAQTLWSWAIEVAARSGLLFELCGIVLEDKHRSAFHQPLKKVLGGGLAMGYTGRLGPRVFSIEEPQELEAVRSQLNDAFLQAASDGGMGLQTINIASFGFIDPQSDLQMRRDALRRTAMVEIGGRPAGTGFLVGPDLLLTAAHVLDSRNMPPQLGDCQVMAVFDFVADQGRSPAETGQRIRVDLNPVGGSLPTPAEREGNASDWNADADHLDFLLLRLQKPMADDTADGSPRGFFPIAAAPYAFDNAAHLQIHQHPLGQTQLLSAMAGPFDVNPNGTRVRYLGNTLKGSSGSAVLDMRGRVVAMHHFAQNGLNQGVLISAIAAKIPDFAFELPPAVHAPDPGQDEQLVAPSPPNRPDPFDTTRFGLRPFANRKDLRRVVRKMLRPDQGRLLVINGGQDSGKSYSWRYLTHLEGQRDDPRVKSLAPSGMRAVKVDLDEYTDVSRSALLLRILNHLCVSMKLVPADAPAQPARSVADLVRLVDAKLNGTDVIWWLFFDSLDRHVLEQGHVDELIARLGLLIDEKPAIPLRMVLSSRNPVNLPGDLTHWAHKELASGLDRTDVEAWLRLRAVECNRAIDEAALQTALDGQFAANQPPPSAMKLATELPSMLAAVMEEPT